MGFVGMSFGAASSSYIAKAVSFDGTNDLLSNSASILSDSKLISGVITVKYNPGISTGDFFATVDSGSLRFILNNDSGNFEIKAYNSSNVEILRLLTSSLVSAGNIWRNIMFSADLANASNRWIYIEDSSSLSSAPTYTDDTMELSGGGAPANYVASEDGVSKKQFDISRIWLNDGQAIDWSLESNRRKVISANGKPVDFGYNGSFLTGSQPKIYLEQRAGESPEDFAVNKGSGGDFTITGTLTQASTSPSD